MQRARTPDNEWYTPPEVYLPIKQFLGHIDLDPCANPERHIPARQHICLPADGLALPWVGRVFVNPPYSETGRWVAKALTDSQIEEVILLVPNRTETCWFQALLDNCSLVFLCHRVNFWRPNTPKERPKFGSVLAYRGPRYGSFWMTFREWGPIWLAPQAGGAYDSRQTA